jgi:hypothetical protein
MVLVLKTSNLKKNIQRRRRMRWENAMMLYRVPLFKET